jgi:hypothetical protein
LSQYEPVFGSIPPGRPPDRGFEHTIELEVGATPVITTPYRHPKRFKDEIEKAIKELLAMGHIRPNTSPFASSVVLVVRISSDQHQRAGHREDNFQMPFWALRVFGHVIWVDQRTDHLSVLHESHLQGAVEEVPFGILR